MYAEVLKTKKGEDKWSVHNSMGLLYYDLGRADDAIASYNAALHLESDHPAVLRNLAGVHLQLGNASAALPLLRVSAAREPNSFEAWYVPLFLPSIRLFHPSFVPIIHLHVRIGSFVDLIQSSKPCSPKRSRISTLS